MIEYTLSNLPAGYSLANAEAGEQMQCQTMEFVSSEHGELLISRLEGLNGLLQPLFKKGIVPSRIENLLIIIYPDKKVKVYCNELTFILNSQAKRNISKGEAIEKDDIADILSCSIQNVVVPENCGVSLVISVGWRKGFFYDYSVLSAGAPPRSVNFDRLLGNFYSRLLFQELLSISEAQMNSLITWEWFPFVSLTSSERTSLLAFAAPGKRPTEFS